MLIHILSQTTWAQPYQSRTSCRHKHQGEQPTTCNLSKVFFFKSSARKTKTCRQVTGCPPKNSCCSKASEIHRATALFIPISHCAKLWSARNVKGVPVTSFQTLPFAHWLQKLLADCTAHKLNAAQLKLTGTAVRLLFFCDFMWWWHDFSVHA